MENSVKLKNFSRTRKNFMWNQLWPILSSYLVCHFENIRRCCVIFEQMSIIGQNWFHVKSDIGMKIKKESIKVSSTGKTIFQ